MVGLNSRLSKVIFPEVRVTSASGVNFTLEEAKEPPVVKLPLLVNKVPEVPMTVIVEEFGDKVPAVAILMKPAVIAWLLALVLRVLRPLVVPVILMVVLAAPTIAAPMVTVRRKALAAVGLIVKLPLIVRTPEL